MSRELVAHNRPVFDQLHPNIYRSAIGLVVWFVVSAWVLFDRQGYIALSLAMITLLLLIAVGLPWLLSLMWRKHGHQGAQEPSFHDWRIGDFAVWGSKIHGMHAAIDVLLPLAAVAFGLTAIGIVFAVVS